MGEAIEFLGTSNMRLSSGVIKDKVLFIIRGLPGSGKSTLGHILAPEECYSADDYFDRFCNGHFIPSRLSSAHGWCKAVIEDAMEAGVSKVAVANTFTQGWEMKYYEVLAETFGYRVFHLIVENRHNGTSVHNVPQDTVEKMRKRFEVKL